MAGNAWIERYHTCPKLVSSELSFELKRDISMVEIHRTNGMKHTDMKCVNGYSLPTNVLDAGSAPHLY
jgi:hypothetical protein